MKKPTVIILISLFTTISLVSCKCHKKGEQEGTKTQNVIQESSRVIAPVIIYKTNADYYNNVPVILSDDKTDIVSYPGITDVYYNGKLAYPTRLENGYLLDNRGVSKNVAFLSYTYEQYSKLPANPKKKDLLNMIIDKNPLIELYKCNSLPINNIDELNKAIKEGLQNKCENLIN